MTEGLPRRIKLAFILQALLASVVITAGVMLTGLAVRHSVIDERLLREADAFWTGRAASPAYPLPRTSKMASYLDPAAPGDRTAPRYLRELAPGRHRVVIPGGTVHEDVLVDHRPQGTFYLVFESGHIDRAIVLTGLASLLLSLLATYLVS